MIGADGLQSKYRHEMLLQFIYNSFHLNMMSQQSGNGSDILAGQTAGPDIFKISKIVINIQSKTMSRDMMRYMYSQGTNFFISDPDSGVAFISMTGNIKIM